MQMCHSDAKLTWVTSASQMGGIQPKTYFTGYNEKMFAFELS